MFVCAFVYGFYHDNSKLRPSDSIDLHQTGSVGEGSDHLQLNKFWPSCAPGKGVCGGAKILATPYYSQRAVFASLSGRFFHFALFSVLFFGAKYFGCSLCRVVSGLGKLGSAERAAELHRSHGRR